MMRCRNRPTTRAAIGLETLEGRRVLSAVASPLVAPLKGALTHGISYLDLQGQARGTTATTLGKPDEGTTVTLKGSGFVAGMGQVELTGSIQSTGFVARGHVHGTITLTDARGHFTLKLQGPLTEGFQRPKTGLYHFESVAGTGDFQNDFGSGTIGLTLSGVSYKLVVQGKPDIY